MREMRQANRRDHLRVAGSRVRPMLEGNEMICPSGKTIFNSPTAAQRGLRSVQKTARKKRQHGHIPCRVYRCDLCRHWHLTAEPGGENAKRAA